MTPEELAVIQAAIALRAGIQAGLDPVPLDEDLTTAVDTLVWSCPECNAGGHTCPGDGEHIPHGATDCGAHKIEPVEPKRRTTFAVKRRWHLIVAGDRVLSKSGGWLEVAATQEMIDGVHVTLTSGGTTRTVVKAPDEKVTVRRGEDGRAADEWARRFPGSGVITS